MKAFNDAKLNYAIQKLLRLLAGKSDTGHKHSSEDFTQDSSHRFVTDTEKNKWNSAEKNVQADWNVIDNSSDAYINNKPTSLPANGGTADYAKMAEKDVNNKDIHLNYAPINNPIFTGAPFTTTPNSSDISERVANCKYVYGAIARSEIKLIFNTDWDFGDIDDELEDLQSLKEDEEQ